MVLRNEERNFWCLVELFFFLYKYPVPFLVSIYFFISLFMLLLDMDKKVDLREFISTLKNRTHQNAVVFKEEGVPGIVREKTE